METLMHTIDSICATANFNQEFGSFALVFLCSSTIKSAQ